MQTYIICVQTLCGKITPAGIGSSKDRHHLERWRELTDATLLGAGSLREADPEFRITSGEVPDNRIRAIITMSGHIPADKKIFSQPPYPLIFTKKEVAPRLSESLGKRAKVFPVGMLSPQELDLGDVTQILEARGVRKLLIEGGGRLNYYALKQNLVDKLIITIAPKLLGANKETPLINGPAEIRNPFVHLELESSHVEHSTGELFVTYKVIKKE
ncbi:MAG: RibD family protein [Thermodesulfobacteria bacterium]|nr:RibD family protein [Thermodesulfobacteriota bacterium]